MSQTDDRAAHLVRALEASLTGDTTGFEELYTDDVTAWSPALTVTGRDQLAAELVGREGAFSDLAVEVDADVFGDKAVAEWVVTGSHTGPLVVDEAVVIEPTGRRLRLHGVTVAEFSGSRIRAVRQYWDEVELLEGMGLLDA